MVKSTKTRDIKLVYQSRGIVGPDSGGGVGFNQPRLRSVVAEAPKMETQKDDGNQGLANAAEAGAAFAAGQALINNREEIAKGIMRGPPNRFFSKLNKEQLRAARYGYNNEPRADGEYGGLFRSGETVPSSFVGRERGPSDFGTPRTIMRDDGNRPRIPRMDPEEEGAIPSDTLPIPDTPRTMGLYSGDRMPRDTEFENMLGDFRARLGNLYDRIDNPPKPQPKEVETGETTEMTANQTAVAQAPIEDTSAVEGLAEVAPEIAEAALI